MVDSIKEEKEWSCNSYYSFGASEVFVTVVTVGVVEKGRNTIA